MATIEEEVISYLSSNGFSAFSVVPSDRPHTFVTAERTGGRVIDYQDTAQFAIQSWGHTKLEAANQAYLIAKSLGDMPTHVDGIAVASVESVYYFPDPESRHQRYQLTVQFVYC